MAGQIDLTVPDLTTQGPAYATQISDDLDTISTHNHDGVSNGTQINIAGQIIQGDLSLDGYSLDSAHAIRFVDLNSIPSGSQDLNELITYQNNLGFINGDGYFIALTDGNGLAPSVLTNLLNFTSKQVSATFTIFNTDTYNLININSSSGAITGTLPVAATVVANRIYLFRDVSGNAGTNHITIQVAVSSGNTFGDSGATSFVISNNFGYVAIYTDGVSKWFSWTQNIYTTGQTLTLGSGGVLSSQIGSAVNLIGSQTHFTDNTPPLYGTAQTRAIVQPLIVSPGVGNSNIGGMATGGSTIGSFEITHTDQYFLAMSKIINGATISFISFQYLTGGTPPTSGDAVFSLYSLNLIGPSATLLATYSVPTSGIGANTYVTAPPVAVSGSGSVVDDDVLSYFVEVIGDSTNNFFIYPAILQFTNITKIGQM